MTWLSINVSAWRRVFLLVVCFHAGVFSSETTAVFETGYLFRVDKKGESRSFFIPFEKIRLTPSWNHQLGKDVPISAMEAIKKVNEKNRDEKFLGYKPVKLELMYMDNVDRWAWKLRASQGGSQDEDYVIFVVLMNGDVYSN